MGALQLFHDRQVKRGSSVLSGINSAAVNSYPINGGKQVIVSTSVQAFYWEDSMVYDVSVNENVNADCVTIDFLPRENRTTSLQSRSSTLCC